MASITLEGLKKTYAGNVAAVKGVDLHIQDGEFVVLVGLPAAVNPPCCAWWQA